MTVTGSNDVIEILGVTGALGYFDLLPNIFDLRNTTKEFKKRKSYKIQVQNQMIMNIKQTNKNLLAEKNCLL